MALCVALPLIAACGATPRPAPAAIAVLARTIDGEAEVSERLAAGLAIEVGHFLSRSPHIVVRTIDDPRIWEGESFRDVADRLGVDFIIWLGVRDATIQPIVTWQLEPNGEEVTSLTLSDGDLRSAPSRIAEGALAALTDRQRDDAVSVATSTVTLQATDYVEFLALLGQASSRAVNESERAALYERIGARVEDYAPAMTEVGAAYLELAGVLGGAGPDYDRAESALRRAFQLDADYPPARRLLASYLAKRGRSEESVTLLKEGLIRHPDYPGFHDQLGYVLRYAGFMDASIESYKRSQQLDRSLDNLVSSQDQITKSLIYLGDYSAAMASHLEMESFLTRLGKTPDEKEWFYKGVIHLYASETDRALDAFRRAEELDSASVWTEFGRAYAGIARRDRRAVANVLDQLERLDLVDGERHYRLVHFATFLEDAERAVAHLEASIRGGFFSAPYIADDPLTAALRSHPDFARLSSEAQRRHAAFESLLENGRTLPLSAAAHQISHCAEAARFLEEGRGMAIVTEPDTIDDWRTARRQPGCRVTASGLTEKSIADEAVHFYERVRSAGWTRTPDPRDAPGEASLRFRKNDSDCLFNVYQGLLLMTEAELKVSAAPVRSTGATRYGVLVMCIAAQPASPRR
jgi:tetratricopeptide (TPR) repeat protein